MDSKQADPKWVFWLEWAGLLVVVALATLLRYWRIGEVPPGFNSDEAVGAMGALKTLREGVQYSYEGQGGGGALGFYFAAAAFYLFGPSIAAIRGLAAWAGTVGVFANYWAVREVFRLAGLNRARWVALLSSLGLAVSLWHLQASRIAFAGIGVPFLLLPSVYFLWLGLNRHSQGGPVSLRARWPFMLSGLFLGGLMYIYLSGMFAPPFYALFFLAQWGVIWLARRFSWPAVPPYAYLARQFWNLFAAALMATLLLLPMVYVLLTRSELEPGMTRAGQAFFMNPLINQGDPWGLLWRSIVGNFGAYGISPLWLVGRLPRLTLPVPIALLVFGGFLVALWRGLRGHAAYLFVLLWLVVMLLPSILSPDIIPHNLRTIGATTPVYALAALFVVWLFDTGWSLGRRRLQPGLVRAGGVLLALLLIAITGQATLTKLHQYFVLYPQTEQAKAAYHVYAVAMAEEINREEEAGTAFILPRNTAAGDVFRNFTVDFLTELAQAPAAHYWVIDDERTLAEDLAAAAAEHDTIRLVHWKTSKHTGADPKEVIPYYLEKFGHYSHSDSFEYFDIDTYVLETDRPDFAAAEKLHPVRVEFGGQLALTGYGLGDAGAVEGVTAPQVAGNGLLWLRLAWRKIGPHPENLKVSALLYTTDGHLVAQMDKLLLSNILQVGSAEWEAGAEEDTYFLIPIPPATPPGSYTLKLAVYGADSLARLPLAEGAGEPGGLLPLADLAILPARQPVTPDQLELALPVMRELLPGLTLVGFETLPGESVRSGNRLGASLIWQVGPEPPPANVEMSLLVQAGEGHDQWPISEPVGLAGPGLPTSAWPPGQPLRGWLSARIPPSLEPGLYELYLLLTPAADPAEELARLPVGEFTVEGWSRSFEPPRPQIEVGAGFGEQATLVGLDVGAVRAAPGDTLTARLYWQPQAEFERDYTAFVHLIGPDGQLYGQVDHVPGGGAYPTTGWLPGEYIADEYAVPLAADAPPGQYRLEIGLYDPATGQRLPVCPDPGCEQPDNKILLPGPTVQ